MSKLNTILKKLEWDMIVKQMHELDHEDFKKWYQEKYEKNVIK